MLRSRSLRIFLGLVVGLGLGAGLAAGAPQAADRLAGPMATVGGLWLDALTMTVVPLIFALVVTGIATAAGAAATTGVARRTMVWFATLLLGASAVSALVMSGWLALWPAPVAGAALVGGGAAPEVAPFSQWAANLIPDNPIRAAADTAVTPLVVFAVLFGYALTRIAAPLRASLETMLQAIVEVMLVIVGWVLWIGPLGVAALAFGVGVRFGQGAFGVLLQYVVMVSAVCLLIAALAYPLAAVGGRISPLRFARAAVPAQAVAVSTQSSLASLPAMVEASRGLDVPTGAAGVILPLAVSLFRAASAAANIAVALFLADLHGVALGPAAIATGVLVTAVVSLAAVGLPAQVSFFATIGPVCLAMGVPLAALPILLAIETAPDVFRTLGNVTADLAVVRLAGRAPRPASGASSPEA